MQLSAGRDLSASRVIESDHEGMHGLFFFGLSNQATQLVVTIVAFIVCGLHTPCYLIKEDLQCLTAGSLLI